MKKLFVQGFILLIPLFISGQNLQWKIYNPGNSNIPWNKIKSMDFDKNGHLWGCYDNSGNTPHLTEFDGDSFKNYLNDAWVNFVVSDDDGDIWFTTSNMELYKYNGNFQIYTNSLMSSPWLEPIFADYVKNIWIVNNSQHSLIKFDGASWKSFDYSNSNLKNTIFRCFASFKFDLMIGTADSGLIKFSTSEGMVYDKSNSPLPSNSIYALKEGKGDTLWLVCAGNLGYFTGTNWNFFPKSTLTSANSLQIDSRGNIWISNPDFTNGGVFMFDRKNWTVYNKSNSPLPTNQLLDLKIDKNDNIWIATWGSGLVKLSPYASSLSENQETEIKAFMVKDELVIETSVPDLYKVRFFDIHGKMLSGQYEFFGNNFSCNISLLSSGIYLLQLCSDNQNKVMKIFKP